MINVLFFGPVAERVGVSRVEVDFVPGMCVADVRAQLELCYPEAFALVSLAAVDGEPQFNELPAGDSGLLLLSGADPRLVDRAITLSFAGGLALGDGQAQATLETFR